MVNNHFVILINPPKGLDCGTPYKWPHFMAYTALEVLTASLEGVFQPSWLSGASCSTWEGTPRKTNMEPENEPLEEEIPIRNHHFQVPC